MADEDKLKLGKGVAFVKSRLKRLPQVDETWEADFQGLPQPMAQNQTHYLGMVVTKKGGSLLADLTVHGRASVNDLATLLANAMRRPLDGDARRPKLVRLRGQRRWRELGRPGRSVHLPRSRQQQMGDLSLGRGQDLGGLRRGVAAV